MAGRINADEVRHIAHLARLKLADEEVARLGQQLNSVLEYMDKLNEVDTDDVEPTAHALSICNVFRKDEPVEPMGVEKVLANAPAKVPPFFKVPKVLDQDSA